jgi:hypothetical protein
MRCLKKLSGHLVQTGLDNLPCTPQQFINRSNIHPNVDIFLFGRNITFHLADQLTFEWTPMAEPILYPRFVRYRLEEALMDTPVVLVHGARQCGKTTLARLVGEAAGYEYITFDDDVQLAAANADPVGFVADLADKTVLDEVQRVPALFLALKSAVDRERRPGHFILTGSANVLLVPQLADRMEILRLHPLAQDEIAGKESRFIDVLFAAQFRSRRYSHEKGFSGIKKAS